MRLHLITAEDRLTLDLRARELIRFPHHRKLRDERRIIDDDWRHYNGKTHVVHRPARMSADALMAGYEQAKRHFYSPGQILKRMAISRTGLWWNIPRNVGYMLGTTSEAGARRGEPALQDRLLDDAV